MRAASAALLCAAAGALLLAPPLSRPAPARDPEIVPRRLRVLGGDGAEPLYRVRGAAFRGDELAVLTEPEPAVHLFGRGGHRAWGRKGAGPGELANPGELAWAGARLLVRDGQLRKIASFDASGALVSTRPLPAGGYAVGLSVAGTDTLLALVMPGTPRSTLIRLRGERHDTVLHYASSETTVTLSAPGAPTLTLPAPFTAAPKWTQLADGRVAFWDGRSAAVQLLDRRGRAMARLALPAGAYAPTRADREGWLAAIPAGIGGRGGLAPLREKAREQVRFPDRFPPVMSLVGDPAGGVWVLRSGYGGGQRWTLLAEGAAPLTVRLPAGRGLLAVSRREMAVLARTADGAEVIETYAKPASRAR